MKATPAEKKIGIKGPTLNLNFRGRKIIFRREKVEEGVERQGGKG